MIDQSIDQSIVDYWKIDFVWVCFSRVDRWKNNSKKNFNSHDVIIIHNASLIFTIMHIKPRLLIHIQTIMQIRPDPWPPSNPDPYEYSSILSIDYVIPIV